MTDPASGPIPVDEQASRQRLLEVELRRAKEAADAAASARNHFLANMSHELRTPLNAILGYTALLLEEASPAAEGRSQSDLEKIDSAARSLLALVDEVLDFSRASSGMLELTIVPFDPATMMEEVIAPFRPLARRNGNRLEIKIADTGLLCSDRGKIGQILHHLAANSIKYTEKGRIVLSFRFEEEAGERWAVFRLFDSGIGMTPVQLLTLFQPFTQGDPSLTRKYSGAGLGLALAQTVAQALGGEIGVESEAGMGTIFTVRLPADMDSELNARKPAPRSEEV